MVLIFFEFLIYIWYYVLYSFSDISKLDCQKVKRNTKSEDYSWRQEELSLHGDCGLRLSVNKAAYSLSWLNMPTFWIDSKSGTLFVPSFWLPVSCTGQNLGPPSMYTVSKDTIRQRTLTDISHYANSYLLIWKHDFLSCASFPFSQAEEELSCFVLFYFQTQIKLSSMLRTWNDDPLFPCTTTASISFK